MLILVLAPLIALFLILAGYLMRGSRDTPDGASPYECGFVVTEGQVWKPFMVSFFMVGLLFLLFDLELLWIFPLSVTDSEISSLGSYLALLFFNFVAVSLLFEILVETIKQV